MSIKTVRVGDIGTTFIATMRDQDGAIVDCSTASAKQLFFRKPDGTLLTKAAVFTTTGADGKIQYVSIAGDLDKPGEYEWDGRVAIGTNDWHSTKKTFEAVATV